MSVRNITLALLPPFLRQHLAWIEDSPLRSRIARGAFWSLTGTFINRGLYLISSIAVARMLGKTGFGELGIIQSTVGMFGVFAGFGLGLTATKHVAEFRKKDPAKAGGVMALSGLVAFGSGGLMAIALVILAPWLSSNTLAAPHLSGLLQVSGALLFLSALNGSQTGALSGFEAFHTIARVNLVAGFASFPLMIGGAYLAGLTGAVWGLVLSMGVNWLLNHLALRDEAHKAGVPFILQNCGREWKVLWSFSLPAVLAGAMVLPVHWVCNTMLVNRPNGYPEMGILNAANQWFGALLFLPGILGRVVLPILAERIGNKDSIGSGKILSLSIKLNVIVLFPMMITGCIFSPLIMRIYGEDFAAAWPILVVVLITAGIVAAQVPIGDFIIASGKIWKGFLMNMGWGLAFICITWILLDFGAFGVATARLLAYVMHAIWTFWFAYSVLKKYTGNV